jgi:hypothetical protein
LEYWRLSNSNVPTKEACQSEIVNSVMLPASESTFLSRY